MKNDKKKSPLRLFAALTVLSFWLGGNFLSAQLNLDFQEMENYLKTASIVSATPDENAGRTEPWIVELDDGHVKRKAIFKHIMRCRPHPLPDCYKYELAAYRLSLMLDLCSVPPTVEREINGIRGSLQLWIDGHTKLNVLEKSGIKPPDLQAFHICLTDCRVFSNLVYASLSQEDILVSMDTSTMCQVDFSEAFSPRQQLLPDVDVTQISEKLFNNLIELKDQAVRNQLESFLNNDEIEALLVRRNLLVEKLRHTVKLKTWSPFP